MRHLAIVVAVCHLPGHAGNGRSHDVSGRPPRRPQDGFQRGSAYRHELHHHAGTGCPDCRTADRRLPDHLLVVALDLLPECPDQYRLHPCRVALHPERSGRFYDASPFRFPRFHSERFVAHGSYVRRRALQQTGGRTLDPVRTDLREFRSFAHQRQRFRPGQNSSDRLRDHEDQNLPDHDSCRLGIPYVDRRLPLPDATDASGGIRALALQGRIAISGHDGRQPHHEIGYRMDYPSLSVPPGIDRKRNPHRSVPLHHRVAHA